MPKRGFRSWWFSKESLAFNKQRDLFVRHDDCPSFRRGTIITPHHFLDGTDHVKRDELTKLVDSTCDASFVVDGEGSIVGWNTGAEVLFGRSAAEVIGQQCADILQGRDECGMVCSENCTVRQAIEHRHPLGNFDLQIETVNGRQWSNVSVLIVEDSNSTRPYAIYIVRPIDLRKRLEILVRDFVVTSTSVRPENAVEMISATRAPAKDTELSSRELEILRLLARGESSKDISGSLHISRTTVNNHVQHILRKLDAHNRLEAIRRAEHAGLI